MQKIKKAFSGIDVIVGNVATAEGTRDLIEAGCRPGEDFGEALAYAHKLRLAGIPLEKQRKQTLGYLGALRKKTEKRNRGS